MEKHEEAAMEQSDTVQKILPPVLSHRMKLLTTSAIFFGNITFGCCFNFFAPALEDFRIKYHTDVDEVSKIFTVFLVMYCIGALSSGFAYDYINRQLGVVFCFAGMALGIFIAPHCPSISDSIIVLFVCGGFIGFFGGCYDAANVVWMMEIWQSKSGPYIQAQHFFYALGSNIPSLLEAPFLSDKVETEGMTTTTMSPLSDIEKSKIYIPFTIAGVLLSLASAFHLYLFIFKRYVKPPLEEELAAQEASQSVNNNTSTENIEKEVEKSMNSTTALQEETPEPGFNWLKAKLIVLSVMFLGFYQGTEMCTMQFIPTFGQKSDLNMNEKDAAFVLTGCTAGFAVGRLLGIFLIFKVPAQLMLCVNLSLLVIGNFIILLWGNDHLKLWWTGAVILGAGLSTSFPSFCAYMERHLVFTNKIGSAIIVIGSGTAAIYPLIVGKLIEENAVVLTYTNFFSIILCTFSLGYASKLTYRNTKRVM